jgi:hypothetical protein
MYRFSLFSINGSTNTQTTADTSKYGGNNLHLGVSFGFQKAKPINEKFDFYYEGRINGNLCFFK